MPDITKRAGFYPAKRRRAPKTFHIQTEGTIVNITVGLTDHIGRHVTKVEIIPDDENRGGDHEGRIWTLDEGGRLVRQFRDCVCHTLDIALVPAQVTCGTCGVTWCDRCTPTPAARCPFEYDHPEKG